ncbi:hypothetical protein Pcinc_008059 [Petrolisthes cinctipes]|uniref:Coiled-coil domain-containing protein n=1 Tax=Petrolisthes cinctipes TaxID=88211 RepID=A0AAE1G9T1_PETCI|nr:hypothetical protein Pcinc_008059 [Petrolisthes cinctipes]
MAEFQVQVEAMTDGRTSTEDLPQRGRVTEVCREWLLHEDQALAHRLQNEEYQSHLVNNRERNQLLRQDTPKAKQEQIREDHEAAMAQTAFELSLAQQEARDSELASRLALQLTVQDEEKKRQQEEEDMNYARIIMEKEKETVRQVRELRQVEREAAYLGINTGNDNVALLSRKERRQRDMNATASSDCSAQSNTSAAATSDLSDLSDFCLQPTDDMDEEEQRSLQEDQDAEQDGKRRGDLLHEDQLMAIEAQDRELAKVLQEQERAKAKKAREKARQKAMLKKQAQMAMVQPEEVPPHQRRRSRASTSSSLSGVSDQPGPSGYSQQDSPRHTDYDPTYASPESLRENPSIECADPSPQARQLQRPNSLDLPCTSHSPSPRPRDDIVRHAHHQYPVGKSSKPRFADPEESGLEIGGESSSSSIEPSPGFGYTNIACAIDPTYQRRVMRGELTASPQATLQSSSSSSTSSSGAGGLPPPSLTSPISPLPPPVFDDDDDDYPVPPYMPIQGQRRTASLEKKRRGKPPKEKSSTKDGCKQQ